MRISQSGPEDGSCFCCSSWPAICIFSAESNGIEQTSCSSQCVDAPVLFHTITSLIGTVQGRRYAKDAKRIATNTDMQLVSARPLIDQFRDGTFEESDVGAYFMAWMILSTVAWVFATGEPDWWQILARTVAVVITVWGVLHLKKKNQNTFGNQFVCKFFCLGWVVTIRMLLVGIPVSAAIVTIVFILGGYHAAETSAALILATFEIVFYFWLGFLFEQANKRTNH